MIKSLLIINFLNLIIILIFVLIFAYSKHDGRQATKFAHQAHLARMETEKYKDYHKHALEASTIKMNTMYLENAKLTDRVMLLERALKEARDGKQENK